jgi:hypothetical protein
VNTAVVRNAAGELNRILGRAKSALRQIEADVFGRSFDAEGGIYDNPRFALGGILRDAYDTLLVVLEAAEMPETRSSLVAAWPEFLSKKEGLRYTDDDAEYENSDSPACNFIERIVQGLEISTTQEISTEQAWTLNRLEEMLRDTAAIVRRRNVTPQKESDLQGVMHDYLGVCFPGFTLNPTISGTIKNFKPDCGIGSVGAAIEFKIVHNEKQVRVAFSGITEDSAGYKGSKDWTRFYAVLYQAEPFMLGSHFRHDLGRVGAVTWTPIVVNGPTKKTPRPRTKVRPLAPP